MHGAGVRLTPSNRRSRDSGAPKRTGTQRRAIIRVIVLTWRRGERRINSGRERRRESALYRSVQLRI